MNDIFNEENMIEPETNYFKFNRIGDKISGILVSVREQEAEGGFSAQNIYTLNTNDGPVNVSIATKKTGTIGILNKAVIGQEIGFSFTEEIKPTQKGFHPTKVIKIFLGEIKEVISKDNNNADKNIDASQSDITIEDVPF